MWIWLALGLVGCDPMIFGPAPAPYRTAWRSSQPPAAVGQLEDRVIGLAFDGGQLELELYRDGTRVEQVARNRYAVPLTLHWKIATLDNLEPMSALEGTTVLPPASAPRGAGATVVLAELAQIDPGLSYHRVLEFSARFGDPRSRPSPYVYRLPFARGRSFAVLQGFHGAFSHHGSNEYAVDFNCPVATPIVAARPGVVVAVNARAQDGGTSPEFLDDKRANFVIVLHSDGTLGEYMHLSPSGVEVRPGDQVVRGQELGLSGNTGFSSIPHLHFQVMTAAEDGVAKQSFAFELAITRRRNSAPVQGQRYAAWE